MYTVGTKFVGVVAIAVLFSTVAPVSVSANDTVVISNDIHASSNSGGQNGSDGADGEDGQAGRNGEAGNASAGDSLTNVISGQDSYSVIETTASGNAHVSIEQSSSSSEVVTSASSSVDDEDEEVDVDSESMFVRLHAALEALKEVINAYAKYLF